MLPSAVAAGHPATVAAGIEILEEGGSAADAAVAACLASCVAETVMTGLLGGGHAIYWDGSDAWSLDCFVDVPSGTGRAAGRAAASRSARSSSITRSGRGRARSPAFHAGSARCTRASAGCRGRGSWSRRSGSRAPGVTMPPAHAACLAMLAPVFTMQPDGARIYAPAGRPLEGGRGARPARARPRARAAGRRGPGEPVHRVDRRGAGVRRRGDRRVAGRPGALRAPLGAAGRGRLGGPSVSDPRGALRRPRDALAPAAAPRARRRPPACTLCSARSTGPGAEGHTTNLVTADSDGNACVFTSSLGLGYGRLPPRARPAAEQHARRGRPRPRAAAARRADAEHDGAEPGAGRGRARARDRLGGRNALAHRARRRRRRHSRRGARADGGGPAPSLPPRRRCRQRRARCGRASTGGSSRRQGCTSGAGRPSTTTSAASAWSREQALQAIRGEAVTPRHFDRHRARQPTDVTAVRAARIGRRACRPRSAWRTPCGTRGSGQARAP